MCSIMQNLLLAVVIEWVFQKGEKLECIILTGGVLSVQDNKQKMLEIKYFA